MSEKYESNSEDRSKYGKVQIGSYVNEKGEWMVKWIKQKGENTFFVENTLVTKIVDPFSTWKSFRLE